MDALQAFRAAGQFSLRTRELRERGVTTRGIAAAVHRGDLLRVRIGHYALPGDPAHHRAALRVGGVAACVTAASGHGMWLPPDALPHVWLESGASRLRELPSRRIVAPDDPTHVRHWSALAEPLDLVRGSVSIVDALAQVIRCQPRYEAIAVLDSAVRLGLLEAPTRARLQAVLTPDTRGLLHHIDGAAGSGTESIVRMVLRDAGLAVRTQARIEGVGFVDLVVGARVIVEVDSTQWHGSADQQRRDYDRDLELVARGYIVVRVNYHQALRDHPGVLRAIRRALATARGE
ncbi:MAG: DUF559 domain-containing protein [Microcella sp.]|uniref:DUF559 domain-containing protein n=1 Tax=Microcella sp. TaxID=1913979 RepID=UPI0033149C79